MRRNLKMKPFSLKEYLANPNKKLVTRDGREVKRILCTDVKGKYPIVVVIDNRDGNTERAISLTKDGKFFDGSSDNKDIFFAPEKHEGWVNVYRGEDGRYYSGDLFLLEERALMIAKDYDCVATIKIEWEE